jgi:hypothetical protein
MALVPSVAKAPASRHNPARHEFDEKSLTWGGSGQTDSAISDTLIAPIPVPGLAPNGLRRRQKRSPSASC